MLDFELFVAAHYETTRRSLAIALGDAQRADDLAQEAFARAFRYWSTVASMERPVAWVYVVAMNQARRDLRRERRPAPSALARLGPDVAGSVATSISLETALDCLPPRQRVAVVLRYLADLSVRQVAEAMGCAEGTVKSTLHAALATLRVHSDEDDE